MTMNNVMNTTLLRAYPKCIVMESASPPVSPNVVAAILMTQKARVTWGTLLKPISKVPIVSLARYPGTS